jgi:hypothetical protein
MPEVPSQPEYRSVPRLLLFLKGIDEPCLCSRDKSRQMKVLTSGVRSCSQLQFA